MATARAVLQGGAEQVGEPAHGQVDDLGIGPLLEPGRGLRAELVATRRLHDADRMEPGHLQQHVGGGVVDLAGRAAHDPGQADRHVVAAADEQVVRREAPLDVVEGGERLVLAGRAHPEPGAGDLGEVVRVVRLPELEHDVVRHVDDVADRSHPEQREASGQLGITRPDRDVTDDASLEGPAAVGVEDLDGHRADAVTRSDGRRRVRQHEGQPEASGQVAGDARDRHGIGPVGVDLEVVEDVRLDAHGLGEGRAGLQMRGEEQDPVVIAAEPQLVRGAQHPVRPDAGHLAPADLHAVRHHGADGGERDEVAGLHVERTAADLQGLAVARVHDDLVDLVGPLDGPGLEHPGDDDAVQPLADPLELFDGHAEVAHLLPERDRVPLERSKVTQPREQDLHRRST